MSGAPPSVDPLVVEFMVDVDATHAFDVWVTRMALWWPAGHTRSGAPDDIVCEPRRGGRVYERAHDGTQIDWGEVAEWDRPHRLRLLWHHLFPRSEATDVEITFTPSGPGTAVRIVQTGWEALGEQGPIRRERTIAGWTAVTANYRRLLQEKAS
jgi:uncharacterized protein YndB with AHSA1/START domain